MRFGILLHCLIAGVLSLSAGICSLQAEAVAARAFLPLAESMAISDQLVSDQQLFEQKDQILSRALKTIEYLDTPEAEEFYATNFTGQISADTVRQSLLRFYLILLFSPDVESLSQRLQSNFNAYKSIGQDGKGSVLFTGYFQPVYRASRTRTNKFRYPIFRKPDAFETWQKPHPKRVDLEGYDGLAGEEILLQGQELAWLANRFDVFMIQLQGSAILQLSNGESMSVGYAAGTDYPFTGVSAKFLREHKVAWHKLGDFFANQPDLLNEIMSRNNRFILFEEKPTPHAIGSLGVPVLSERTIATDRLNLPPGALALIQAQLPFRNEAGNLELKKSSRLVLNLDTGSALKGPGRVDLFMGSGSEAQERASAIFNRGELYYLFVR